MGAAALAVRGGDHVGGVHVPEPRRSDVVATVAGDDKSATLAFALAAAGVSHEALAQSVGVSRQLVQRWCDPANDSAPNISHICRMPASVRRALGAALVASASAKILPLPLALYERAALEVLSKVSALTLRIEDLRASGDERARRAALQEIHDLRSALDRIERGVLLAGKEAP